MEKGGNRRLAAELGIAIVCPDTSPRGESVPDARDNWQFGSGAGFYLDATELPFSVNYNMSSYILDELTELIDDKFDVDMNRQGIFGHSMGGHGALTMARKTQNDSEVVRLLLQFLNQPLQIGQCQHFKSIWDKKVMNGENMMQFR